MSLTYPSKTHPSDNFDLIDYRYVLGRDNYTCRSCVSEIQNSNYCFLKVDPNAEADASNIGLVCNACYENYLRPLAHPSDFNGHLIAITGPMYAEKTTTSESYYCNYGIKYKKQAWIKPDRDDRSKDSITHSGRVIPSQIISADRPDQHVDHLKDYEVIVIDETQFFSERIIYLIHQLLRNGCLVIINGLKLTAKRDFFGVMHYLLAEADEIVSLRAVCNICMRINCATRTKSFEINPPTVNTGGVDKYYAVCPACDGGDDEKQFIKQAIQTRG